MLYTDSEYQFIFILLTIWRDPQDFKVNKLRTPLDTQYRI